MSTPHSFHVGAWLVEPRLDQLSRSDPGGGKLCRQLPPKAMDVLVTLASRPVKRTGASAPSCWT